jgi:hypothetical protein
VFGKSKKTASGRNERDGEECERQADDGEECESQADDGEEQETDRRMMGKREREKIGKLTPVPNSSDAKSCGDRLRK